MNTEQIFYDHLSHTFEDIVKEHKLAKCEKQNASFNLFTVSSYNSYLENFHSDIIATLLNPLGLHKRGHIFLNLFVAYINKSFDLDLKDFQDAIVTRETGRLDIWIRDAKNKQSIIIENKINNAVDMEKQIDRYFYYAEQVRDYKVKAVIYLSLDGTKKAPPTVENLESIVKNIGAFTSKSDDLASGWLEACLEKVLEDRDSFSFIHQYIKLLKQLANKNLETNVMEKFYDFLSTENGLKTVNTIVELKNKLELYRADQFAIAIPDYAPFNKQYRYKPNYWLYENFYEQPNNFKLDIQFLENGNASIVFWNPGVMGESGREALTQKLKAIDLLEEFESETSFGDNGYTKYFRIGSDYKTIKEVDDALIKFTKNLMTKLKRP